MYVSSLHKAIFIPVPRTASRSVAAWFMFEYGALQRGTHHARDRTKYLYKKELDFTPWAVIRHPVYRAQSLYRFYTGPESTMAWGGRSWRGKLFDYFKDKSFEEFCKWLAGEDKQAPRGKREKNQVDFLEESGFILSQFKLIKFNHLDRDLEDLDFVTRSVKLPRVPNDYPKLIDTHCTSKSVSYAQQWAASEFESGLWKS